MECRAVAFLMFYILVPVYKVELFLCHTTVFPIYQFDGEMVLLLMDSCKQSLMVCTLGLEILLFLVPHK